MSDIFEFRQNIVSGEWVLFATGRKKRPHAENGRAPFTQPKENCPFEDPDASGQEVVWHYPNKESRRVTVIHNKFPAVHAGTCSPVRQVGPFSITEATGTHDVFVYADHERFFADYTNEEMRSVIAAYKKRVGELSVPDVCTQYVLLFRNHRPEAGASIAHPHSQIMALPILPPSISRSLYGAFRFHQRYGKRAHEVLYEWERAQGKRVVYENPDFFVYCPFASQHPGEIRIHPKRGGPHFYEISEEEVSMLADALVTVLRKLRKALDDSPYNYYIHTAPAEKMIGEVHQFYTWHIEIVPKLKTDAGFELGTGIDVNIIDPDEFAEQIRKA